MKKEYLSPLISVYKFYIEQGFAGSDIHPTDDVIFLNSRNGNNSSQSASGFDHSFGNNGFFDLDNNN